jgi:GNAT superfamily N-acetyltransferase
VNTSRSAPPAFGLRPPAVGVDEPALLALHLAASGPDALDPLSTLEWFPRDAAAITREIGDGDAGARAAIVGEVDGRVVGYALTRAWTERGGLRVYLHLERVLPGWRGRGVEGALIDWAEARIRALADAPDRVGPWVYGANATDAEADLTGALLARGYRPAFPMVEMALAGRGRLPEPPLPGGAELVPVEPAHVRAVWESIAPAYDDPGSVAEGPPAGGRRRQPPQAGGTLPPDERVALRRELLDGALPAALAARVDVLA